MNYDYAATFEFTPDPVQKKNGMFAVVRDSAGEHRFTKLWLTQPAAEAEATRLCRKERARFYVVRLICYCNPVEVPVEWIRKGVNE